MHGLLFSLFKEIIDEVSSEGLAGRIALHVLGEPFLYTRLADAVDYAKRKDLHIVLTTNGSLLNDGIVDDLINSKLDELDISIQTVDEKQHTSGACKVKSFTNL